MNTIRYAALAFALSLSVGFGATSCAHAPPNLTPQAVVEFHSTQVIKALDVVMETMHSAHGIASLHVSAQTDLAVVNWHQKAIVLARDASAGWRKLVLDGLDVLKSQLSAQDWSVIAPYVSLAKTLIQEGA